MTQGATTRIAQKLREQSGRPFWFAAGIVGVLAVIGTVAEGASVQNLTAGQTVLGLWEAAFGLVLLYAGYNVFRHALLPRFRSVES